MRGNDARQRLRARYPDDHVFTEADIHVERDGGWWLVYLGGVLVGRRYSTTTEYTKVVVRWAPNRSPAYPKDVEHFEGVTFRDDTLPTLAARRRSAGSIRFRNSITKRIT